MHRTYNNQMILQQTQIVNRNSAFVPELNYPSNPSNRTLPYKTHLDSVVQDQPVEVFEEIVGKDHNKAMKQNLNSYTERFGKDRENYEVYQSPVYQREERRNKDHQNNTVPRCAIIVFIIVLCVLAGLLCWFFKGLSHQKGEVKKGSNWDNLRKKSVLFVLPPGTIKSEGVIYHCPPPAFIYKDRCIRCPENSEWNGTNCVEIQKTVPTTNSP